MRRLTIGFFLLTACTNHGISPPHTLSVELETPSQTLNPLYTTDTNSQHVNELLHAGLMAHSKNLLAEPYLAEQFKYEDSHTLFFRLRKDCRFPNGRAITSEDVEKTLQYFQDPKNQSTVASSAFEAVQKFEKIDDLQFRIRTKKLAPALASDLSLLKILDLSEVKPGTRPSHIPGAGPYKLVRFSTSEIRLERANQPCLPLPAIPNITVKVVRDDLSRFFKLRSGELDLVLNDMNYRKVEAIMNDPSLPMRAISAPSNGYQYMGMNTTVPALRDKRVRRAIALSFDIPTLLKYKSRGMAIPARTMLSDSDFFVNKNVAVVERNLEEARKLLDEAGYSNGSNGKPPLRLTLKSSSALLAVENARVLSAQAKEAGIILEPKAYDWGIFYADVKRSNVDLYTLRFTGVADPHIYYENFHSSEIGRNNRSKYQNPTLDKLLVAGENTLDPNERKKYYDQVQSLIAEELPIISLWHPMNTAVFRKEVKGVDIWPNGSWRVILGMSKE